MNEEESLRGKLRIMGKCDIKTIGEIFKMLQEREGWREREKLLKESVLCFACFND